MVNRRNKIQIVLLLLMIFIGSMGLEVHAAEQNQSQVFDDAKVLSEEQVQYLEEKAKKLGSEYNMNFLVLTTDNTKGYTAQEYADDFYDNGSYYQNVQGGGVYLIDLENREIYISTDSALIQFLTDRRIDEILDAAYEYASSGDYYGTLNSMLDSTKKFLEAGIPNSQYQYNTETKEITRYYSLTQTDGLIAAGGALILGLIVCGIIVGRYRLKFGTYTYPFQVNSQLSLTVNEDRFMHEIVTHRRIVSSGDSGSSGGGSRSSTHTSSSGRSHGGGGRKF